MCYKKLRMIYFYRSDFNFFFFKYLFRCCESFLKEYKKKNANGNRRICYIKNRTKKLKRVAAKKGKPGREMGIYDRKIQHVHYSAM